MGYYSTRKEALLKQFDQTASLMTDWLVPRYGAAFGDTIYRDARKEYEQLIPEIPHLNGFRARLFNGFLRIAAAELAVYKAMKRHGKTPSEAWEVCHEALRRGLNRVPRWQRWLMRRLMFSRLAKAIVARRSRHQQRGRFGDFEVEYVAGDADNFHLGVNYVECAILNFMRRHGGDEFAPYVCMSDIALSDALGWGLTRTQTLADGCQYCDFRFKEGTATQISSRSPAVQQTIEKIRRKETGEACR